MIDPVPVTMVGVYGPVASGKTHLIKDWLTRMDKALVFDSNMEYSDSVEETIYNSPRKLTEALGHAQKEKVGFRIAYVPDDLSKGFAWASEAIWQLDEPRWFIIEECHEFMSPWKKHPHMEKIMRYSRKRALGVVGSSQRIASVHKDFTASSRMSVLFHTIEPADLEAIEDRFGIGTGDMVRKLRPLVFNDATRSVSQMPQALIHRKGEGLMIYDFKDGLTRTVKSQDQEPLPFSEDASDTPNL